MFWSQATSQMIFAAVLLVFSPAILMSEQQTSADSGETLEEFTTVHIVLTHLTAAFFVVRFIVNLMAKRLASVLHVT